MKKLFLTVLLIGAAVGSAYAETIAEKVQYQGKSRFIEISDIKSKATNGLMMLNVEFTNTNHSDRRGYYRVRWIDDAGFDVGAEEAWKPLLVHGDQKESVQMIAPSKEARDFRIQFNAEDNWTNDPAKQP